MLNTLQSTLMEGIMKTVLVAAIIMATSVNAMAVCEYTNIMDSDDDERINFTMKVNKLTERLTGISFDQRDNQLDEISLGCMACHDGTLGKNGMMKLQGDNSAISGGHSMGVDYNNISYRKSGYRNIHNIRQSIKFVDGRLGCLSCHDLQNKEKKHLAAPMESSKLCFECHSK